MPHPRGTALGRALRVVRALPRPVRRAVLGRATAGELPPVPDFVRMLEIGGDLPDNGPTDRELFARFPELATVAVSEPPVAAPARLYRRPGAERVATLVWVHGGAFVSGSVTMAEAHFVGLSLAARGIAVVSLDYRKALHGSHYPDASDDVLAGWRWAVANAGRLGGPVHLGGASAAASLAAGVAKRLRDGAGPAPASVLLAYPAVHAELPPWPAADLAAVRRTPGAVFFSPGWIRDLSRHYAGAAVALDDPYAFPGNGDLAGLPPTFVLNSEADTLRSSGEAYARGLRAAGVEVHEHLAEGAAHGFLNEPFDPAAADGLDRMVAWLSRPRPA